MTDGMPLPHLLRGRFAPVLQEREAADLTVRGWLPPELDGRFVRNGPNPLPGEARGSWFTGSGMLHGVRLRGGRAEWYRNRWVRTRELTGHPFIREDFTIDLAATPANTHVIRHAGMVLALSEAGLPYWVTDTLETVGPYDFSGRLRTAMTAHPEEDPVTGELHLFGTGFAPPYLTYHRVTAEGETDRQSAGRGARGRRRCTTSPSPSTTSCGWTFPSSWTQPWPGGAAWLTGGTRGMTPGSGSCPFAGMFAAPHRTGRSGILGSTFSAMSRRALSSGRAPDVLHTVMSQ